MTDSTRSPNGVALPPVQHKDYYIPGGDVAFVVENQLFRVHSYFFTRESLDFRKLLEKLDPNNPYTLEDVTAKEFGAFLWVFYNTKFSIYEASVKLWDAVLKLANRWGFNNVADLAIRELEKKEIDPVERVCLYNKHSIPPTFLIPTYAALCQRPVKKAISVQEAEKIGLQETLNVLNAREMWISQKDSRNPSSPMDGDQALEVIIREVWGMPAIATNGVHTNGTNGAVNGANGKHGANGTNGPSSTDAKKDIGAGGGGSNANRQPRK